ncbi:tyrosine-protein phosphatase [Microbacterium esteraromaticum]|uniref:tyrosine-protein phosphatase n=1 Tax=Microbacterium esteraromaticum TaxID=57043 RepID=UPI0023681438|nr:tyrosine-protein phosphatase [Microbacterium esteraromaticum]WDH77484.1 tyrosine-protein phosphatase [Microbacterium esteraromaticum]
MTPLTPVSPPLSAPVNLRELRGIAIEGGRVRPGFALRADDLSYITDHDARVLVRDGLSAVIDLRSNVEARLTGRGPLADLPVTYHHISLLTQEATDAAFGGTPGAGYRERYVPMYVSLFEGSAPLLVQALSVIVAAPGSVAFHCSAGKDRTGVLAAALLLTLGASDDEICADYGRTGPNVPAVMERTQPILGPMMQAMGIPMDAAALAAADAGFHPDAMRGTLDALRARHGGDALAPLRRAGLSDDRVAALRAKALRG